MQRPAKRRARVGRGWEEASQGSPPPARSPLTHSGLRGGGAVCRSRGGFSLQGGPGRGAEVALPSFPGAAGPEVDGSFFSLRVGGQVREFWAMTLNYNSFSFLEVRLGGEGTESGRAGRPAATARRCWTGGRLVSQGGERSGLWLTGGPALLAPRRPSHSLLSGDDPHLPAPRPEVSKVNEKFHP